MRSIKIRSISVVVFLAAGDIAGAETRVAVPVRLKLASRTRDSSGTGVQVPILGWGAPPTGGLRPIIGMQGASLLGDALDLGDGFTVLGIAPGQTYALLQSSDGGVAVFALSGAGSDPQAVNGALAQPDRIAFSPGGSAIALYSSAVQRLQVVTGLPASPRVLWDADLSLWSARVPSALALSDDGQLALAATTDGERGSVVAVANGVDLRQLLTAGNPSAMAFLPQSHDALMGDSLSHEILLLTNVADGLAVRRVGDAGVGVGSPLTIVLSSNGQQAYVAQSSPQPLLTINLASGNVGATDCPFSTSDMTFAHNNKGLILSDSTSGLLWVWEPESAKLGPVVTPL